MFTHITGVIWLISSPDSYYSMANSDSVNMDSLETASVMIVFGYGVFIYSSKFDKTITLPPFVTNFPSNSLVPAWKQIVFLLIFSNPIISNPFL